jgi:hypothetical protein
MDNEALTTERARTIALEEGLKAAFSLDKMRLQMLHEAVEWILELTELSKTEVRREIAAGRGRQVALNLATISAAQTLLTQPTSN